MEKYTNASATRAFARNGGEITDNLDSMALRRSRNQGKLSAEYPPEAIPIAMFEAMRKELSRLLASPHSTAVRRFSCSASERYAQSFLAGPCNSRSISSEYCT